MAQYIPKEPLVAEIERTQKILNLDDCGGRSVMAWSACFKKFIDTLEVKEVDLEKYYHDFLQKEWFGKNCVRTMSEMMAFTAKHFFELGLKVSQKGE